MRLKQSDTSRVVYFVAVDITDLYTRETSLTNGAVWYSIDGGAQTSMTTPTMTHIANGVFKLAIDEAGIVTLGAGVDEAELVLHVTADEISPVTMVHEVFREKVTAGRTLAIAADGSVDLVTLVTTTTTNTDMRGTDSAALASVCTETRLAELAAANLPTDIDAILVDTGTTLPASIAAIATAAGPPSLE